MFAHLLARISDKRRLMLLIVLLLSSGFIATSLASYYVSKASIHNSIVESELPLTSDNVYSEIQKDLIRPIFIFSMMASDTFLRDWVLSGENGVDRLTKYLAEVKGRYETFTSFFVSDKTRLYYHAAGVLKSINEKELRDRWYFRVRDMQAPYEINVDVDLAHDDALTIFINYRVTDYNGRFIGVSGVGLSASAVRTLINDYQSRYRRRIYFVDKVGKVVLAASRTDLGTNDIRAIEGLDSARILQDGAGSYQYKRNGRINLLNVRFIPELNWYLFVEKDEDEALGEIRQALYLNLAICLVITLIVLFMVTYTLNRYQTRLETMARTDKLTGLANRQAFELLFKESLQAARRNAGALSMIMLDIDQFKSVNDRFGHLTGDAVIRGVADTLRHSVRDTDIVCRWGGEEFLVVARNCSCIDAMALAEKIRLAVAAEAYRFEEQELKVTVSLGVSELNVGERGDEAAVDGLLQRADHALYQAKQSGRNCSCSA